MKIIVVDGSLEMSIVAAGMVADFVRSKRDAVLGLCTGETPVETYRRLISLHRDQGLDLSGVVTFNLDEYMGLGPEDPKSFDAFMHQNLFDQVNIPPGNIQIPNGLPADVEEECRRYEDAIAAAGGTDLQLLGIGQNGHIGFNEPGTSFSSRTRVVRLTDETRRANARYFQSPEQVPHTAISMGIATIMESRRIILLASGSSKAKAVSSAVEGPVTEDLPASILQRHPDATFILDQEAAALLGRDGGPQLPVWMAFPQSGRVQASTKTASFGFVGQVYPR